MINNSSIITKTSDIITSKMDDELLMMSMKNNAYYGLNSVGRDIWELLESTQTLDSLCEALMKKYSVSLELCHDNVTALINRLEEKGLVQIV